MKYVKHLHNQNWLLVVPESEDDEYLRHHGIFKLVEHETPHESWDPKLHRYIEELTLQRNLRIVHKTHRVVPIDAYEPDRPKVVESATEGETDE